MNWLIYNDAGEQHALPQPSPAQLGFYLPRLNNQQYSYLGLQLAGSGWLNVCGGVEGRALVVFQHSDGQAMHWGKLLDSSLPPDPQDQLTIQLLGGQQSQEARYCTVPLALALSVAQHFLSQGRLPPGLQWQGVMPNPEAPPEG